MTPTATQPMTPTATKPDAAPDPVQPQPLMQRRAPEDTQPHRQAEPERQRPGQADAQAEDAARPTPERAPATRLRSVWSTLAARLSSSLSRRIIVLNLAGLVALLVGFLVFNQFRAGLIEARVQSLLTQGEIIAAAVAASATVESDGITVDPDRLLQLQTGESLGLPEEGQGTLEFSINPERVAPVLRRLVTPTRTRARVFDRDGQIVVDTATFYSRGDVLRLDLPPPKTAADSTLIERSWNVIRGRFGRTELQLGEDAAPLNGKALPEVARALNGIPASTVRVNRAGQTIVSAAVPIQRFQGVRGTLLLSTQGGDIDAIIANERFAILEIFLIAAAVMLILSFLLAGAIAEPMRKLAAAAESVRRGVRGRVEIPDFSARTDEIGLLSVALRDMTKALYNRIEGTERFAADVAHELKNPLTSLRSAVETMPLARNQESRDRLLAVIQHDVRRLDRLISDISDASRLDAELARSDAEPVDLARLIEAVANVANEVRRTVQPPIVIDIPTDRRARDACMVLGHDLRLSQVLNNLIDNARSFAPMGRPVHVRLRRDGGRVILSVEDEGPGIPEHALERIFERFYTDRPEQGFGQNSGLGLSISRQIVEAHGGAIAAENRPGPPGGARFVVALPALTS